MEDKNYPPLIENIYEFKISKGQSAERIDTFLTHSIHNATRNKVQLAIEAGRVLVNGEKKRVSYRIASGDHIICKVLQLPPIELIPEDIPLNIIYEDNFLLVVNKPSGMCSHPGVGNRYGTLVNALLYHFGVRESLKYQSDDEEFENINNFQIVITEEQRPGLVHRIDKDTTGLLVIAKDPMIHTELSKQFANKTTEREYIAIVWGSPKLDSGSIEGNIGRSSRDRTSFAILENGGKPAVTNYLVLERFNYTALVKFKLLTGRTHQIRVHSGSIGHKLFGDVRYGGDKVLYGMENPQWRALAQKKIIYVNRQMLHAKTLGFVHPITKENMLFDSELPADMQELIECFREYKR